LWVVYRKNEKKNGERLLIATQSHTGLSADNYHSIFIVSFIRHETKVERAESIEIDAAIQPKWAIVIVM